MFDLTVIGGGPGGYVCAIRAAQMGGRVALVESDALGGTCLNRGCVPTKAMLEAARRYVEIQHAGSFGLKVAGLSVDFPAVLGRQRQVVRTLRSGVSALLASHGVEVKAGCGSLASPGKVRVTSPDGSSNVLESKNIVIATGSSPVMPPIPGVDLPGVLNSDAALQLESLPESMVIVGGGVIGMEFASYLNAFGASVTVLEVLPQILLGQDVEVAAEARRLFSRQKIAIHTGVTVREIRPGLKVVAELPGGEMREFTAEKVLIATGRKPNLGGIDTATAGIAMNGRCLKVDGFMRTTAPSIYGVGDVTGSSLAHAASAQGMVAAQAALGQIAIPYDGRLVPSAVFSMPPIASVGLTEDAAKATRTGARVVKFPFNASGKALIAGEREGFVKVVADGEYGDILGVHMIGAHAEELIHEAVVAMSLECTVDELARTIHAHPTLSEATVEAMHGLDTGFLHLPRQAAK